MIVAKIIAGFNFMARIGGNHFSASEKFTDRHKLIGMRDGLAALNGAMATGSVVVRGGLGG